MIHHDQLKNKDVQHWKSNPKSTPTKVREKKNKTLQINMEEAFDKNQIPIHDKSLSKLGTEENSKTGLSVRMKNTQLTQ